MGRQRRLPRLLEKEVAKLLGTLGFGDYASSLWNLATSAPAPASDADYKDVFTRHILEQARFDPAVVAAGETRLPLLRRMTRTLANTRNVASERLLDGLGDRPSVVILVGAFDRPTQERVVALTRCLSELGATSFLVIATEGNPKRHNAPAAMGSCAFVYWPDDLADGVAASARHLALFLHISGAASVIVSDSRLGLATIGQYGRALANAHRLFVMLDVPAKTSFVDVHHLRGVAAYATILARSSADAEVLRARSAGLTDRRIEVWTDDPERTFGTAFDDPRTAASRTVCATLLGRPGADPVAHAGDAPAVPADRDMTVTILFHRERELAVPALASLSAMVNTARKAGITVEARALVDRGDDATRATLTEHGRFLDDICDIDLGSPASARNAAVALARGRYLAFLDGDDLWGADWLSRGYQAAVASPAAIWHPEALFAFYGSDCDRRADADLRSTFLFQQASDAPSFDARDLLFENMWSVNAIAATEVYRRFPYRKDDWDRQTGIEDWRWNLETLGHGVPHGIVPDTLHLVRIKETGSFGQLHQASALLPLLV